MQDFVRRLKYILDRGTLITRIILPMIYKNYSSSSRNTIKWISVGYSSVGCGYNGGARRTNIKMENQSPSWIIEIWRLQYLVKITNMSLNAKTIIAKKKKNMILENNFNFVRMLYAWSFVYRATEFLFFFGSACKKAIDVDEFPEHFELKLSVIRVSDVVTWCYNMCIGYL